MSDEQGAGPTLRVVAGSPTEEELAALVVVLSARGSSTAPTPAPRPGSAWAAAAREGRPTPAPRPGAWVGSARPH